jgi:polyhydroxyalkanoate synthesis regulator protein
MRETDHVKKYGNKKLYHIEGASYVSMLELSDLVAAGHHVVVTADETTRDLTLETLARAFYERVKVRDQRAPKQPTPADVEALIARVVVPRPAE